MLMFGLNDVYALILDESAEMDEAQVRGTPLLSLSSPLPLAPSDVAVVLPPVSTENDADANGHGGAATWLRRCQPVPARKGPCQVTHVFVATNSCWIAVFIFSLLFLLQHRATRVAGGAARALVSGRPVPGHGRPGH